MRYLVWSLLILLIFFRFYATRPVYENGDLLRITASITSDPITYTNSQMVRVAGLKVYTPLYPDISYGDRVVVTGIVSDGQLTQSKVLEVAENTLFLSRFRKSVITFYQSVLPEPEAGLMSGITLGSKGSLVLDFYERTKFAGLAHVVVASGTNITFLVGFLMAVLTVYLPRKKSIYFAVLICILYLFVSGFDPPLIRAAVMSGIVLFSQQAGRLASSWRVLLMTAGLMLIYRPDWIIDIGFILSFVSTMSLMLFEKKIRSRLTRIPNVFRESLSTSLAAQIGVAPILFVTFGRFNVLSPIINVLVLWTVPILMILGVAGGIVGLIWPTMGKLILYLSYPLLKWFTTIVSIFGS